MAELLPQENGSFRIAGFADKVDRVDAVRDDIATVCQLRLDILSEVMELLGDNEVELDMSDRQTASVVRVMAMSAVDHFMVCDFEMSASISEIVLELDPEDHFSVVSTLVYCYAMLEDADAVQQLLPFADMPDEEKELVSAVAAFRCEEKNIILPEGIVKQLLDPESDLSKRTAGLWLEIPNFKTLLKI